MKWQVIVTYGPNMYGDNRTWYTVTDGTEEVAHLTNLFPHFRARRMVKRLNKFRVQTAGDLAVEKARYEAAMAEVSA